jgi:hypothetical protein
MDVRYEAIDIFNSDSGKPVGDRLQLEDKCRTSEH